MRKFLATALKVSCSYRNAFSAVNQIDSYKPRILNLPVHTKGPNFTSVSEAVSLIESGSDIYIQGVINTPTELLEELCRQVQQRKLEKIRFTHNLLNCDVLWAKPELRDKIRSNCLFIGGNIRSEVNNGNADYTPVLLSQIPALFLTGVIPVDVALFSVTPPDENGFCSLSLNVDCSYYALQVAKKAIAVVNDKLPFTFGDTFVHSSHFDALVCSNRSVHLEAENQILLGKAETKIGKLIAENLVDDGATLQLGIGAIPNSVLSAMKNHKDLGVHSELVSNGIVELMKKGVITGACKTLDPGKVVTTFATGTKDLYDFIDRNPTFEFRGCAYTNDAQIIRKQRRMTAINSAIEIDLTGQVASDSIGTKFYSGFGGQLDFIYGTSIADDNEGKPIIAISSITSKGASKIVPTLRQGAGVVTTRGHVRYVVTEHGIAQLWGKSIRQRAFELIQIAHPDHREGLEKAAFERLKCMPSKD